ncbi:DUF4405 domain-containing protein [Catenovulum sp. SM1970]|uniref:DUF4405 domain-containing protein n=1 Tax=Marinifaba aquimaris TaxID=2741323 RepID=UPI001573BFCC|nr:DUF4405 domain-containing protein [Marinifaba aquimaris]NTS78021.1 DUF4405 domain-containing protein [Marinifaba aquimaris]
MKFEATINKRTLVSLSIFLAFAVMLVTSVLMFLTSHNHQTALIHTVIGFVLVGFVLWHIKNNFRPLKQYWRWRNNKIMNTSMLIACLLSLSLLGLALAQFAPFQMFYQWGQTQRTMSANTQENEFTYQTIDMPIVTQQGQKISIDMKKGPYFSFPQYAIWLETLEGEFVQPLYVTSKLAQNDFYFKASYKNKENAISDNLMFSENHNINDYVNFEESRETASQRLRPESLPVFLHKLGKQSKDGLYVPTKGDLIADAYTGATMLENFLLNSKSEQALSGQYRVRFEINQSFDFNHYYSSDRFPEDDIYSGDGFTAQPSVVYEAIVDFDSTQTYFAMQLIGRGHHSGRNGDIYTDMENLTTAKEMIDRVIVGINE